jgi:hypothetical protein
MEAAPTACSTDLDTVSGAGGNNLLGVQDGAADDKVECGEGHDTVYFDQELEMVAPDECEGQNPIPTPRKGRGGPRRSGWDRR